MKRILVVWEDRIFAPMELVVKRRLAARRPGEASFPHVVHHTADGNGKFARYVGSTWPRVRGAGTPGDAGRLDHLVCVVDGDKLSRLLPDKVNRVDDVAAVESWHANASDAWTAHLRASVEPSVDALTVHGHVLRWSKESLALAGYDRSSAAERLGLEPTRSAFVKALAACSPDPRDVPDTLFTDRFRSPLRCLEQLREASGAFGPTKNAPEVDDCIKAMAHDHLATLCARVLDIDQLVDRLWALSMDAVPPPTPPSAQPAPTKRKKRS